MYSDLLDSHRHLQRRRFGRGTSLEKYYRGYWARLLLLGDHHYTRYEVHPLPLWLKSTLTDSEIMEMSCTD